MIQTIVLSLLSSVTTVVLIAILGKTWFEARLKASIEHEYKKQFELFQRELDQRQKVELVADLLAEYLKTPYGETVQREQRTVLNKLSLQAALWLPAELTIELLKRLQNKPDAKLPSDIILTARQQLIGDASISVEYVTLWNLLHEQKGEPVFQYAPR